MSAGPSGGFSQEIGALPGNSLAEQEAASLHVASRALDAADARRLLVMLGLIDEPRPVRAPHRDHLGRVTSR